MKTVKDAFELFRPNLHKLYSPEETEAIILLVLTEVTNYARAKLKAFPETELSEEAAARLGHILQRLATGEPVQYILGHTGFYGLDFEVNPAVLIPRPETEELVQWVIDSAGIEQVSILDIGTGSGCIPVSLKYSLPNGSLSAIDISEQALETAKRNAQANHTAITFIHADILNYQDLRFEHKFDIIVSNPPYVTETDKLQMHNNVTGFEPHTALFVPENEPLLFYEAIADFALQNLNENGLLFFEINESFGQETVAMLVAKGFKDVELRKDMSGRDRMVKVASPQPLSRREGL